MHAATERNRFEPARRLLPSRACIHRRNGKMRSQIAVALCSAVLGFVAPSSPALAQQKTAKACLETSVIRCRAGGVPTDRQGHSSIKDLMESIIDPSADVLWGAVTTVVDQEGIHETFPKTPEEWLDLRRAAARIIGGGDVRVIPGA